MSPIQCEEGHGVSSGTGIRGRRRSPSASAISSSICPYVSISADPDLDFAGARLRNPRSLDEITQHIADTDRLGGCGQPRWCEHHRQAFDQRAQRSVALRSGSHHHAGTKPGQRWSLIAQDLSDAQPRAQMPGRRAVAETAEVDDLLNAGVEGEAGKVGGCFGIALLIVAIAPRPIE
jgi:hypothetical protein